MSCARSRCQRRRLFGPRSLPPPQPVVTIAIDPAPPATLTPSFFGVRNFTFLFFNIELLSRALAEVSRDTRSVSQQGISTRSSEAHQNTRVFAFLAPREEARARGTQLARARASAAPEGRHPRSAPEVGDPKREGARAPPERVLDSGRGGARALEEKSRNPPTRHFFFGLGSDLGPRGVFHGT